MTRFKTLALATYCLATTAHAQTYFPSSTNLCETNPWKLVWYDEFNSSTLDANKWFTFGPDGNWGPTAFYTYPYSLASQVGQGKVIYTANNVVMTGNSCILRTKYEPTTVWGYDDNNNYSSQYRPFTSGMLLSRANNAPLSFNQGRFEMRARVPYYTGSWATFWLYGGGQDQTATQPWLTGSEIDILEYNPCIGGSGFGTHNIHEMDDFPWNLHGQRRGTSHHDDHSIGDFVTNSNASGWHIFTGTWDDNFIRIYVDGVLSHEEPRYKDGGGSSSTCVPNTSTGYTDDPDQIFPRVAEYMTMYLTHDLTDNIYSENVFGICTPINDAIHSHDDINANLPDEDFEIDWVRVYQRDGKIQPGLSNQCPELIGQKTICDPQTGLYTYEIVGGDFSDVIWAYDPRLVVLVSSTDHSLTVQFTGANEGRYNTVISASFRNNILGCESTSVALPIVVGPPPVPNVSVTTGALTAGHWPNTLTVNNVANYTNYNWSIKSNLPNTWVTSTGTTVYATSNYTPILYHVTADNKCGSSEYANFELLRQTSGNQGAKQVDQVYPNPATDFLMVNFSDEYYDGAEKVQVKVIDNFGKTVILQEIGDGLVQTSLDVSGLAAGVYTVEISGKSKQNHLRFTKL